jgi:hypothetical protein
MDKTLPINRSSIPPPRSMLCLALIATLIIPLAHGVWDAQAPGRCIRILKAFDRATRAQSLLITANARPTTAIEPGFVWRAKAKATIKKTGDEALRDSGQVLIVEPAESPPSPEPFLTSTARRPAPPLRC